MNGHHELYAQELVRGEKVAWTLRWFIYGLLFCLAGVVYLLKKADYAIVGMAMGVACLCYNAALSGYIRKGRSATWIRYAAVTLDIVLITIYNCWETFTSTVYTPVSTAMLLVYPLIILFAAVRLDRVLIVYATVLALVSMNGIYVAAFPRMEASVLGRLSSGDIPGQVYRSIYVALSGAILYFVPRIVDRLLRRQLEIEAESRDYLEKANTDRLTGLPNRRELEAALGRAIEVAERQGLGFAVLFIDLDGFKAVNDRLGHAEGDRVLVEVARRLRTALRDSDIIARVGGDEFVALARHAGQRSGLEHLSRRILEVIDTPIPVQGGEVSVGASVGISIYPSDGLSADALVRSADRAMYMAKEAGKGTWAFAAVSGPPA